MGNHSRSGNLTRRTVLGMLTVAATSGASAGTARAAVAALSAPAGSTLIDPTTPAGTIAAKFADTVLRTWPDPLTLNPAKGFEYTNGMIMHGLGEVFRLTADARYLDYITRFFKGYVDAAGTVKWPKTAHDLDLIQPGNPLILLQQATGDQRWKTAADQVYARLLTQPQNPEGGFWHKDSYPGEMWADSLYQGGRFATAYGQAYGVAAATQENVKQILLFAGHAQLPSGLVRHAWDYEKNAAWADRTTGRSPIVWSRAVGWMAMDTLDALAALPTSHQDYGQLLEVFTRLAQGIRDSQDPASGLWYQVVDQPHGSGNFIETSGSGFFVYALSEGVRLGLLNADYRTVVDAAWTGLLPHISQTSAGAYQFNGTVEAMGVASSYRSYVNHKTLTNSPHGLMAAMVASTARART